MKAIDWIRSKAELVTEEVDTLDPEFATDDQPAGTRFRTRYFKFFGYLPRRMRHELNAQRSELTDDETLKFGEYVSTGNRCIYTRSEVSILA